MAEQDIRWVQRFSNFQKALSGLSKFIEKENLNELEEQGLIQAFEYTHELAWKTLKDYLIYQGINNITGSRDATREAFSNNLIKNGEAWMEMIQSRNESSHTYNEETSQKISKAVKEQYYSEFTALSYTLSQLIRK